MLTLLETALKEKAQAEAANSLEQILCLGQAKDKALLHSQQQKLNTSQQQVAVLNFCE